MNNLSRRDFLKLGGAMAGALAIPKNVLALSEKPPWYRENVTVGNLDITPIIFEHHEEDWLEIKDEILPELDKHQTVICEYFPYEYKGPENKGLMKEVGESYDELNFAFLEIEEKLKQTGKDVVVVDPAFSSDSVKLRLRSKLPTVIVNTAIAEAALGAFVKVSSTMGDKSDRVAGKIMAGVAGGIVVPTLDTIFLVNDSGEEEIDLRHVFIAKALIKLGNEVLPGTQMAIIYPPAHWDGNDHPMVVGDLKKGILYYLQNTQELAEKYEMYSKKYPESKYPDFYRIRGYSAENGDWEKTMEIPTS